MMEESHMHKRIAVTAAVDVIAGNADLLSEILLCLPARSLIRFTVVCKPWCSIITNMQFRLSHCRTLASSNALPPSGIYFYDCLTNLQKIESLPLIDNVTGLPPIQFLDKMAPKIGDTVKITQVKVTQSCKGLLMCIFTARTGVGNRNIKLGVVYNPAIKEYRPLPNPYDKYYEYVSYNLIYDPSEPPYYKALCVTRLSWDSEIDVSVYVPGSESWRYCCRSSAP
ncbi:F-box protein At5g07610-like [Lycium barbarum]|uniref:F-box protein At5g07610-like n=1 Tax=Lycium barbarum TaxID=112863 RepID=UPI00293E223D|nr:F-box protein At5g07610-like [Lycium barbarum]